VAISTSTITPSGLSVQTLVTQLSVEVAVTGPMSQLAANFADCAITPTENMVDAKTIDINKRFIIITNSFFVIP
jgi:hypothetical protein